MKRANSTSRNMSITRLLQKYNNIIWEDNGPLSMANWGMPSATIHAFTQYLAVLLAFVAICAILHFVVCNFVCVCCRCVTRPACDSLFLLVWRLSLPRGISSIPAIFASSYVSFSECFFFFCSTLFARSLEEPMSIRLLLPFVQFCIYKIKMDT